MDMDMDMDMVGARYHLRRNPTLRTEAIRARRVVLILHSRVYLYFFFGF